MQHFLIKTILKRYEHYTVVDCRLINQIDQLSASLLQETIRFCTKFAPKNFKILRRSILEKSVK